MCPRMPKAILVIMVTKQYWSIYKRFCIFMGKGLSAPTLGLYNEIKLQVDFFEILINDHSD